MVDAVGQDRDAVVGEAGELELHLALRDTSCPATIVRDPLAVALHPDLEVLALAQPEVDRRACVRQMRGLHVGEKTLSDLRAVDRAELGLRALGERERGRRRRQERDAERGREHPGHGPAILRRVLAAATPAARRSCTGGRSQHDEHDARRTPSTTAIT